MKQTRVLIECHSLLGDLVLMTPMILALKENRPEFLIDIAVGSEAEINILRRMGNVINEYYIFNPLGMNKKEILELMVKLRKNHYDYGVVSVSENSIWGALFLKAVGCKYQIGETSGNRFIDYNYPIREKECLHRVERNLRLLYKFDIKSGIRSNTLFIENELKQLARNRVNQRNGERIISICLGTGNFIWKEKKRKRIAYNCKKWGYDRFFQLTKRLLDSGYKVIWIGGNKEKKELPDYYYEFESVSLINLIGKTTIEEAIGILSISDLVIGADTGLMHCAAAMNIKTLCLIGATDPKKIRPYSSRAEMIYLNLSCSPCYGTKEAVYCKDRKCLKNISVDMVYTRAEGILKGESIK